MAHHLDHYKEEANLRRWFNPRRRRCLSVVAICKEAGLDRQALQKFLASETGRGLTPEYMSRVISVLQDFGYIPYARLKRSYD